MRRVTGGVVEPCIHVAAVCDRRNSFTGAHRVPLQGIFLETPAVCGYLSASLMSQTHSHLKDLDYSVVQQLYVLRALPADVPDLRRHEAGAKHPAQAHRADALHRLHTP